YPSLPAMRRATGKRVEPWRIAVLYGNGEDLAPEHLRDLKRVASGALAAGISLILVDVPTVLGGSVETISLLDDRRAITPLAGPLLAVRLPPRLPAGQVASAASRLAGPLVTRQRGPRWLLDLLPPEFGQECSAGELRAPVGFHEGQPVEVVFGDTPPHGL